jgi:hypothetical protein
MSAWTVKSESDIDRVWVRHDADGNEVEYSYEFLNGSPDLDTAAWGEGRPRRKLPPAAVAALAGGAVVAVAEVARLVFG